MIFLFQPFIPHYRVPLWSGLSEALDNKLVVVYGEQPIKEGHAIKEEYNFKAIKIRNYWLFGSRLLVQNVFLPFLKYGKPDVVIMSQNPKFISNLMLLIFCKIRGIPVIMRGHGGSIRRNIVKSKHLYDRIHRLYMSWADAFVAYTRQRAEAVSQFLGKDKTFYATNTLDIDSLVELKRKNEKIGKDNLLSLLDLPKKSHYLVFIGRLTKSKRLNILIELVKKIQDSNRDVGCILIGDGPERKELQELVKLNKISDIYFTGYLDDWEESAKYLSVADIAVIPGHAGLSINHSLAFGLPVISFKSGAKGPYHPPEIDYISEGCTGYLANNDSIDDLVNKTIMGLDNLDELSECSFKYALNHLRIKNCVDGHVKAIQYVLARHKLASLKE